MDRKNFMKSVAMLAGASTMAPAFTVSASERPSSNDKVTLKKGLGFGMIQEDLSLVDKFKLVKDLGFDGVELNTPTDLNKLEVLAAKEKSGIEIPSVVNKDHWKMPLSDPNPEIRKQCIKSVAKSLYEVKEFGGDTVLVVPGVVNEKVTYEQAYNTALNSVRELIPHVEETGMQLAIENVWNNFLLSPVEAKRFVDEINHPLVGWYFDIGNILRYGWPEHWIKTLNSRIMKLHIKEFSVKKMFDEGLREGFNVNLLEGDNNWPNVMKAVNDVGHKGGWLTVEVRGGDRERLKDISKRMDEIISYL
ncbi:sugar phosphate isomerase/epimerase family protein [Sunxiuqinia elliptica]|uniref:Hexulose-6-phosphate isomerase n=1 Tax=Sunxiuqinia elliptica TaxID=655355 RepID=A0A4R6H633_9BACT|nr:sugar phosphate isomerase/epimerase family protein [Sunxiuqinia elliptica]TDO03248.1 hexulose-6-phosphate isomerase [Sunxiuqinia elliptica]TDO59445.1 hexulose-6-phosphate isomerase [Sunxiuqinia elliptica]